MELILEKPKPPVEPKSKDYPRVVAQNIYKQDIKVPHDDYFIAMRKYHEAMDKYHKDLQAYEDLQNLRKLKSLPEHIALQKFTIIKNK